MYQMQTERILTLAHDSGGRVYVVSDLTQLAGECSKIARELCITFLAGDSLHGQTFLCLPKSE